MSQAPGPIVTFTSDFGTTDGYVAAMKGVVLCRAPNAVIVDQSHGIAPQDIHGAAWLLRQSIPFFPPATHHVAVVDPGVGSDRRGIVLELANGQRLLGPDNGIFSWITSPVVDARVLENEALFLCPVSPTFHGRDIFASVAGHLAAGVAIAECGPPLETRVVLETEWVSLEDALAGGAGKIIHHDRFGNLITNIEAAGVSEEIHCAVGDVSLGSLRRTFSDVAEGQLVAYVGSGGTVEIARRNGDATTAGLPLDHDVRLWRQR